MHSFLRFGRRQLGARPIRTNLEATVPREKQPDQLAVRASLLAVAVTLCGCSASELLPNGTLATPANTASTAITPNTLADLSQPNYRRIVGDNVRTILPKIDTFSDLEISGARLVDHLMGRVWLTCLKFYTREDTAAAQPERNKVTTGNPQYFALFIQGDKIIDSRVGVVIDQCYKETFEPFDLPPPPAPKKVGP
jgi:hypothetical protein